MLKITKLTDYATLILCYLALESKQIVSANSIAKASHLQVPTVAKILKLLLEAKLVISNRGKGGGYKLARSAETITLADIIAALEGRLAMTACCDSVNACLINTVCTVKENWQVINKMILTTLTDVTLHDMMRPLAARPQANWRGIPITQLDS